MGNFVWTPETSDLGEFFVESDEVNVSIFCNYIIDPLDLTDTDSIAGIELIGLDDPPGITITEGASSIKLTGVFPISMFDEYEFFYVDKGSSDKLMTPVKCQLADVPDEKDIFKIICDSRKTIDFSFSCKATTVQGQSSTHSFNIKARQDWGIIGEWTKDYFENRY